MVGTFAPQLHDRSTVLKNKTWSPDPGSRQKFNGKWKKCLPGKVLVRCDIFQMRLAEFQVPLDLARLGEGCAIVRRSTTQSHFGHDPNWGRVF